MRWQKKKHSTNLATSYDTRITYSWCCSIVLMCYNAQLYRSSVMQAVKMREVWRFGGCGLRCVQ
ncbi:hypothetical protein [Peijinzhouia sedimentorum]